MLKELTQTQDKPSTPGAADPGANAIYYVPDGAFDRGLPDVVPHLFADEQRHVLAPDCPTGLIALDLSASLALSWPATTPLMLARYVIVRAGESLSHAFQATGEVFYVMRGAGTSAAGETQIAWKAGDVFCLPGASRTRHVATQDSALLAVTDEPQLAYLRLPAPDAHTNAAVAPALFDGERIDAELGLIHSRTGRQLTAGKSVIFATTPMKDMKTVLPSLTAAVNTLEPGGDQRPHRHNPTALTLSIEGDGVHSMVAGQRIDWIPFGVMVTPPRAPHSHHNRGPRMMKSFVVQDGAFYYACRNPGFNWEDAA